MNTRKRLLRFFQEQGREFLDLEKRVHENPGKRSVHDLRVSARKLRSLQELFDLPSMRGLKKVVQASGELRDLDVGLEHSREFSLNPTELADQRRELSRRLRARIRKKDRAAVRRELGRAEKHLKKRLESELEFSVFLANLRLLLSHRLTPKNGHRVRIELKRVRYLLEALRLPVAHLTCLQEFLGDWHDLQVLEQKYGRSVALAGRKRQLLIAARAETPLAFEELSGPLPE